MGLGQSLVCWCWESVEAVVGDGRWYDGQWHKVMASYCCWLPSRGCSAFLKCHYLFQATCSRVVVWWSFYFVAVVCLFRTPTLTPLFVHTSSDMIELLTQRWAHRCPAPFLHHRSFTRYIYIILPVHMCTHV